MGDAQQQPRGLRGGRVVSAPLNTSDIYPTLLALAGAKVRRQPVLDGADVLPLLSGAKTERGAPIFFNSSIC